MWQIRENRFNFRLNCQTKEGICMIYGVQYPLHKFNLLASYGMVHLVQLNISINYRQKIQFLSSSGSLSPAALPNPPPTHWPSFPTHTKVSQFFNFSLFFFIFFFS
jgi:hypothetical protein